MKIMASCVTFGVLCSIVIIAAQFTDSEIVGVFWIAIVIIGSLWIRYSAQKSGQNSALVLVGAAAAAMLGMVFAYAILFLWHKYGW